MEAHMVALYIPVLAVGRRVQEVEFSHIAGAGGEA